jgi:hypothetical protein
MADNVIPFEPYASRENQDKAAQERKTVSDRNRAKKIRQRLNDNPMIHSESDRFHVAKNLGRILDDMEAKGHKREKLLRKLGRGQEGDSTKQFYNYTLPADAVFEKETNRVRKLTKHADKYLPIAEAAADTMNEDKVLIMLRLFENTKYQVTEDISDEQLAYLEQIRKLLVSMADAAISRNDLKSYLEMLESDKIGWDIDGSFGNFPSIPGITLYLEDRVSRHVSYLGYVPSVLLYRQSAGPSSPIMGEAFQIDFDKNSNALNDFLHDEGDLPKKNQLDVSVNVDSEVWFGVAPMESSWKWEPAFEKRYLFSIQGYEHKKRSIRIKSYDPALLYRSVMRSGRMRLHWLYFSTLFPALDGDSIDFSVSPHIDPGEPFGSDKLHREQFEGRWLIALDNFDEKTLGVDQDISIDKGQFVYERVNLESCEKYLRQLRDPDDQPEFEDNWESIRLNDRLWHGSDQKEAWYSDYSSEGWPQPHTVAPKGSIAKAIELNLLQADSDDRLDAVLFETVAERVQNARYYYQSVLEQRDHQIAKLLKSWKN